MNNLKCVLLCAATALAFGSFCQAIQEVQLKPIHKQGLQYFYNFKKVDGGAYGLQIPLQSLEDDEINKLYKNFKTFRTYEIAASMIPLAYLLSAASSPGSGGFGKRKSNGRINESEFAAVEGFSIAAIIGLELLAHRQLKKAVDKYNSSILNTTSVGFVIEPMENRSVVGLGISHKF